MRRSRQILKPERRRASDPQVTLGPRRGEECAGRGFLSTCLLGAGADGEPRVHKSLLSKRNIKCRVMGTPVLDEG